MANSDIAYTLVYEPNASNKPSVSEFKSLLEKGDDETKIDAMKQILITMLNSDPLSDLLMHIIRYVMPSKNKELKKLLYFYWEICGKYDSEGKLKHEMILVCNAIQRDLQHPNEYIRGNTLRFLSKLKEPELLEPLVPSVRQCLEHRHAYVRKYAAFAVFSIFNVSDHLLPDAPELLYDFLEVESDATCKRNAFVCLGSIDRESSLRYIQNNLVNITDLDSLIQLAFIEFIRKDSITSPDLRPKYLHIMSELLESNSHAVIYEAATTLSVLSNSQIAITSAASKFNELAIKEPDNNVKLIALERIEELIKRNPGMLDDMCLDILRILSTPSLDVRKKVLKLSLTIISSRNVEDVIKLLRKELTKTLDSSEEKSSDYRQLLISSIHSIAIKFHEVAASVVDLLLGFIGELNRNAASDIITFVKEVVEKYPDLRSTIIHELLQSLKTVKSGKIYRGSLWIIGEYCYDEKDIQTAWRSLRSSIGEIPILASEQKKFESSNDEDDESNKNNKENGSSSSASNKPKGPVVLPDGTYATESALNSNGSNANGDSFKNSSSTTTSEIDASSSKTPLRALILEGDFYLATVLSSTLVKLVLRFSKISTNNKILNALKAEAMLIMVSILRVGNSSFVKKAIDEDSAERILSCIRFLSDDNNENDESLITEAFLEDTKKAFESQIKLEEKKKEEANMKNIESSADQPDDLIKFRQFTKDTISSESVVNDEDLITSSADKVETLSSRLKKITQLTGFSDPVYAEAYVKVHQFDVTLDVLIVNQTTETLRNLTVEFATLGDLKVVDKPTTQNIGPHGFHKIQSTIKVTSADTGVIFGNIVYDGQHSDESTIVILSDVHVDIMDYIKPATCSENSFRKMWNEFEWENKITIKTQMNSLKEYLEELLKGTNMNCLTPGAVIGEECQFLSANLYSKSSFGEDALANLCIEKSNEGSIIGHVRIRSKGQGLALSLGDKVAAIARKTNKAVISSI
ncbi:hypothetical protein B5S29_g1403 [[Candida] boidinii]|uniref:Unnamed protein product n=1 Tax=Candida boidinii TaxID=5477 RepID=A0ACB5TM00_CANBO|nr:hypothetical protein B5S29_g1403 [[Candida] boidinii]GME90881.1 unnamed protein product [[Candida] boidinii]